MPRVTTQAKKIVDCRFPSKGNKSERLNLTIYRKPDGEYFLTPLNATGKIDGGVKKAICCADDQRLVQALCEVVRTYENIHA
jgi:hypothetical protein